MSPVLPRASRRAGAAAVRCTVGGRPVPGPGTGGRSLGWGAMTNDAAATTFYEAVGGEETFSRLTRRFYEEVAADPGLRPVYPSKDLGRPRSTCGCS